MANNGGPVAGSIAADKPADGTGLHGGPHALDLRDRFLRPQLPALDGLRAVAVFLVIFHHFGLGFVPGGTGVTMFFVLSGFLITWLLLKESEAYGRISLRAFYRRRALRIFPAFYAYWFGIVLLLAIADKPILWSHAVSSFVYLSNYYNAIYGDPDTAFSHTWSLAIEEQFYLLWPVIFVRLRHDLARMSRFLICAIAAVWIHRLVLWAVFDVDQGYFYAAFDTRMDSLLAGCLLAVILKRGVMQRAWSILCAGSAAPFLTLALLAASIYLGPLWFPRYRDVAGFALEPLLIAALLVQLVGLSSTAAWRWLDSAAARFLGRISYSLYLYQQITLWPVRKALSDEPLIVQLGAAISLTVAIASASYYVIERPFLALKSRERGWRPWARSR